MTTATPSLDEPAIPYRILTIMNRLQHAWVGVQFETGSRLKALDGLRADIRFLRTLLAESDQLALKMLALEMLVRDLHTLSQLMDSEKFVHEFLPGLSDELSHLTDKEGSLAVTIKREFRSMAQMLLSLNSAQALGAEVELPEWMITTLYKPNATGESRVLVLPRDAPIERFAGR